MPRLDAGDGRCYDGQLKGMALYMARIRICKEKGCKDAATTDGFCRLHYLRNWKEIKDAKKEAGAKRLNRYIERVLRENPDDYLDIIRRDLERPDFEDSVVRALDFGEDSGASVEEGDDENEIDRILRKLKIEEGF